MRVLVNGLVFLFNRQMVARGLLDTLRAVGDDDEQTTAVLTNMVKLSEDSGMYVLFKNAFYEPGVMSSSHQVSRA